MSRLEKAWMIFVTLTLIAVTGVLSINHFRQKELEGALLVYLDALPTKSELSPCVVQGVHLPSDEIPPIFLSYNRRTEVAFKIFVCQRCWELFVAVTTKEDESPVLTFEGEN